MTQVTPLGRDPDSHGGHVRAGCVAREKKRSNRTNRTLDGTADATWIWDTSGSLATRVGEYGTDGQLAESWLADPTSATGSPLASYVATSGANWLLSDASFSVQTAARADTGTISGTRALDPFGGATGPTTGVLASEPISFHGQYLDARTGSYDMRARSYSPATGRFDGTDPLGVPVGSMSVNAYWYAEGNPLVKVDPTGLVACGPMDSGDCNGRNLIPLLNHKAKVLDDAGYLAIYNSLTRDQRDEIGFDEMTVINNEAVNRQQHMKVCSEQEGCLPPCPDQGYNVCQAKRAALLLAGYVLSEVGGMALTSLVGRACVANTGDDFVNLATPARTSHILDGEVRPNGTFGGGHRSGTGFPGKSEFPAEWSDARVMHNMSDVATDPSLVWRAGAKPGDFWVNGNRGGIDMEVLIRNDEIWTGYPTNVMRNP
ncbi:RHS repeat-associated core domain-containing protein [Cellulomonas sp. P5_C6]